MDINPTLLNIGALMSIWLFGLGAGMTFRMFKQIIERASRP